jgi:sugar phosphate isomerase/epimerase
VKRITADWTPLHEPSPPPHARAALQLYTVRDALRADREGTFRRIRELGYTAVETAGFGGELPSAASRAELEPYGLDVVSSYFVGPFERFGEHLDEQRRFGNDTVVLGLEESYFQDRVGVERAIALLGDLAAQSTAAGIHLGYHNHPWEVNVVDGETAIARIDAELDPAVFLEFDFYWAQVGGLSIDAARPIVEQRLRRLHLKDGPLTDTQVAAVFGQGDFDLSAAIAAAPAAEWHIVAFDEFDGDMLEASGADLRYLLANRLSQA